MKSSITAAVRSAAFLCLACIISAPAHAVDQVQMPPQHEGTSKHELDKAEKAFVIPPLDSADGQVMMHVVYEAGPDQTLGKTVKAPIRQDIRVSVTSRPAILSRSVATTYRSSCSVTTSEIGGRVEKEEVRGEVRTGFFLMLELIDGTYGAFVPPKDEANVTFNIEVSGLTIERPISDDQCVDNISVDGIRAKGSLYVPFDRPVEYLLAGGAKLTFTAARLP
ncbi:MULTISPECIES: hypothetical protein [Achromobacter]|uniref:hypothetical protein n=1 Tax=Achromobacter TaxID=222 RepID=UPI0023F92357|nr:hypothetical protein [Achromobacter anxifer]MDF8363346.1 hypothetical protein [Achromobacter anxifer]